MPVKILHESHDLNLASGTEAGIHKMVLFLRRRFLHGAVLGALFCSVVLGLGVLGAPAHAEIVTTADAKAAKAVFKAIDRNRFKDALRQAHHVKSPEVVRVLIWSYLTANKSPANFDDIKAFLEHHGDWPRRTKLLSRAEETMPTDLTASGVMKWFDTMGGPVSSAGRMREVKALLALDKTERAKAQIRKIWVKENFTKAQEREFYKRYRKYLTKDDNANRLERLIWDERFWPAYRQLSRVDAGTRRLALARLWLMTRQGNVDKAIADLEKHAPQLLNDPGLIYERLRWRRRKGHMDDAEIMLGKISGDPTHPDKWWTERAVITRDLLQHEKYKEAYNIASHHGLKPDNADTYSEAEWISGWIALRFLKEPKRALQHFTHMHAVVNYPISVARGAYWAGRAAQVMGRKDEARKWLKEAAQHSTTYYGQLARARLGLADVVSPKVFPAPPSQTMKETFNEHPMTRAAQILFELDEEDRMRPFLQHLSDVDPSATWQTLTAKFAAQHGRPDLAIRLAKASAREGTPLGQLGYPTVKIPVPKKHQNGGGVEAPLVLAIIRQESAFYTGAKSPAGARGLMQVMPATAKRVAKANRMPYDRERLINDSAYNLIIGQVYLSDVIEEFNGSYPMALAAYNAGPQRVKRWLKIFGDPRKGDIDIIDWVELIPYSETRNYVQRVLENLSVYRARLKSKRVAQKSN
jgi:soluble lytic murein transglycosylase